MSNKINEKLIPLELTFKELTFLGHVMQSVQINGSDALFVANFIEKILSQYNEVKENYIDENTTNQGDI